MSTSDIDYTLFSCPNSKCKLYGEQNQGNIAHHSWIGKSKNIRRLRCRCCAKAFSENKGTLRERAKVEEDKQVLMLKCFRWGVCTEGTADICEVTVKTVQLFQCKASHHGQAYHEAYIKEVEAPGVQVDEIRAKQAGTITWAAVAIVMSSFLILGACWGKRNQSLADNLFAQIWGRCRSVGIFLSDGWRCYYSALLRCYGKLYQPRRQGGQRGRKLAKRLRLDSKQVFYGQVIKQTVGRFLLCAVRCRAVIGTMAECLFFLKAYRLGHKIHTSHIERWFGTLRCHVASLRRKSRCLGKTPALLGQRIWIFITLHNWILTHDSLTHNGFRQTPAMAAGLIDRPLTYSDFIWSRIREDDKLKIRIQDKLREMQSDEVTKAAKRTKRPRGEEKVIWKAPPREEKKEAA